MPVFTNSQVEQLKSNITQIKRFIKHGLFTQLYVIINNSIFSDIFNRTRLIVINKSPGHVPWLNILMPIKVAGIMNIYLESLAQPELKRLANSSQASCVEQGGFKNGRGTSQYILSARDLWSNLWRRITKMHSTDNFYLFLVEVKSAFDNVETKS